MDWKSRFAELKVGDKVIAFKPCPICLPLKKEGEDCINCYNTHLKDKNLIVKEFNDKGVQVSEKGCSSGYICSVPKEILRKR